MTHNLLAGIPEKRLPPEEEQELAKLLARKGPTRKEKEDARESLVLYAMWESFFYARRVCRQKLDDDEIFSLSYDALTRAAGNFHSGSVRFFAYAKVYVRGAICKAWKSKDVVKNSSSHETLDYVDSFNPDEDPEFDTDNRVPSPMRAKSSPVQMIQTVEPEFETISLREDWAALQPLLRRLTDHERLILKFRYEQEMNFPEMANLLGISRQAAQATHKTAILKLRSTFVK